MAEEEVKVAHVPSYLQKKDSKRGYRIVIGKEHGVILADLSIQYLVLFSGKTLPEHIFKKTKHKLEKVK